MNPPPLFCANTACASRGKQNAGNIVLHVGLENRFKCTTCEQTFVAHKGTVFYQLKTDHRTVEIVLTLLAKGCPPQAIVHAFGLDPRTVKSWQEKAGAHCQKVHEALVQTPQNLQQVQADEIRVRCQKRLVLWMAMALCVCTRLWLGGVVSHRRDKSLAKALAQKVKACAQRGALLITTDGWGAYREAFAHAFRSPLHTGKPGRPLLLPWPQFVLAQTVKWQEAGRTLGIRVCHLLGNKRQIARLLPKEQVLNTAYIERLNATFRASLCCLCRRTRALARHETTLTEGMYLVGCVYNFCTFHHSLRQEQRDGSRKWRERTPAMAAGLTDTCWRVGDLLSYRVAPPPVVPKKRRGRKPQAETPLPKRAEERVTL